MTRTPSAVALGERWMRPETTPPTTMGWRSRDVTTGILLRRMPTMLRTIQTLPGSRLLLQAKHPAAHRVILRQYQNHRQPADPLQSMPTLYPSSAPSFRPSSEPSVAPSTSPTVGCSVDTSGLYGNISDNNSTLKCTYEIETNFNTSAGLETAIIPALERAIIDRLLPVLFPSCGGNDGRRELKILHRRRLETVFGVSASPDEILLSEGELARAMTVFFRFETHHLILHRTFAMLSESSMSGEFDSL